MSNKNNLVRSTLTNQEAAYLTCNDRLYKKSLSFQDTDNVSYFEPNEEDDNDELQGKNEYEDQEAPVEIERTNTATYDRDDSLYDVISFGKQTPFRLEHNNYNNLEYSHDMNNHEVANSNEFKINNLNHNSTLNNNLSILNLKDTTIDDMFLMDNMEKMSNNFLQLETSSMNNKKPFLYKSNDFFNRINLNPDFELSFDVDNEKYLQSTTRVHQQSSDVLNTPNKSNNLFNNSTMLDKRLASPSRIPVLNSRSKAKNLSDSRLLNETNPIGPEEKKEDVKARPKEEPNGKVNGAFKLYSTSNKKIECTSPLKTTNKPAVIENDKKESNRMSPFVSLETETKNKHVNESSSINMGSKQNLKSKTQALESKSFKSTAANKSVKKSMTKNQSEPTERSRPPTNHDINYSLESDESIMVDNLLNNPVELKKVLREGKMDKEQLNQLQENYLHLLEQYAEKENFIDTFRLGYNLHALNNFQAHAPATPSSNMFQVRV